MLPGGGYRLVATREVLTDKRLKALKPAPSGSRYEIMDAIVPGLGIRITDKGVRTFMLRARFPGGRKQSDEAANPTRRALGEYGALTLEEARDRAREWHALIKKGVDPKEEQERQHTAEKLKRANTFAAVAEDFIAEKLPGERKGREVERIVRNELVAAWGKKAVADVSELDVLALVKIKRRTAPAQARNLLGLIKRLFSWAVDQRSYGLKLSPAEHLKPSKIVGEKAVGDRVLNDDELFALWRAAGRIGYPYGVIYRLLLLTALRLNEVADASWPEIDAPGEMWTIPAARMKGRNGKARAHAVPLTAEIATVLAGLPRFTGPKAGKFLFSTTNGVKPVWMSDKAKKRIDARMLLTLRALARSRGEDPEKVMLPAWVNHDIRRSVRSNLSKLRIAEEAREALLAHARPGLKATYDHHDYFDEKKEALELWAARLRAIVEPASVTPNVVRLRGREVANG